MKPKFFLLLFILLSTFGIGQSNDDYFREVEAYPAAYSGTSIAVRIIDALGFRYYWATEGLRARDLDYRPTPEARSSDETIQHIFEMVSFLAQSVGVDVEELEPTSFELKRSYTFNLLKATREKLVHSTDEDLETYMADFGQGRVFPFWNLLNGQITDCIWHCGQIASFRRTSGNPINPNVSFFNGVVVE